jgi:hypothetical protein
MDRSAREALQLVARVLREQAAKVDGADSEWAVWLDETADDVATSVASDEALDDGEGSGSWAT